MRNNERLAPCDLPEGCMLHHYEDDDGRHWSAIFRDGVEVMAAETEKEHRMIEEFSRYEESHNNGLGI